MSTVSNIHYSCCMIGTLNYMVLLLLSRWPHETFWCKIICSNFFFSWIVFLRITHKNVCGKQISWVFEYQGSFFTVFIKHSFLNTSWWYLPIFFMPSSWPPSLGEKVASFSISFAFDTLTKVTTNALDIYFPWSLKQFELVVCLGIWIEQPLFMASLSETPKN